MRQLLNICKHDSVKLNSFFENQHKQILSSNRRHFPVEEEWWDNPQQFQGEIWK